MQRGKGDLKGLDNLLLATTKLKIYTKYHTIIQTVSLIRYITDLTISSKVSYTNNSGFWLGVKTYMHSGILYVVLGVSI